MDHQTGTLSAEEKHYDLGLHVSSTNLRAIWCKGNARLYAGDARFESWPVTGYKD